MSEPELWTVERLIPGGEGFLKLPDGRAAFVPGGLPGDQVRVHEVQSKKSWVRAVRWELVEGGPDRVVPACAVQEHCGGCDWMTLEPGAQLRHKAELVREALTRTGGLRALPEPLEVRSCGPQLGYRGRLRLHAVDGRLGFHGRGSHELIEVPGCPVASPRLDQALSQLRESLSEHPEALQCVSEIEVREAPGSGPRITSRILLQKRRGKPVHPTSALKRWRKAAPRELGLVLAGSPADREWLQTWPLDSEVELQAPPGAFTQVNWAVNQQLVADVVKGALKRGLTGFCDLYCGAGNFTLPLLARGLKGVGVDLAPAAVEAASTTAAAQGFEVELHARDVANQVADWIAAGRRWPLVLLDPPRSGAGAVALQAARLCDSHLLVCACDPVTLARDLKRLLALGFELEQIVAYDMFPQTHHVETLVWLKK